MPDIQETIKNLAARGFTVKHFSTGAQAADDIASGLVNESIGFGGSKTVEALGLYERLGKNNRVFFHWKQQDKDRARRDAAVADVYITSANALAQTGEIVNIDGTGNRVSATLFGAKKVYFLIGKNKLTDTYDQAVWRARNIAAPLNARRFGFHTPCASGELKCHDCSSPERICKGLVVLWGKMMGQERAEVVLIDEDLGF